MDDKNIQNMLYRLYALEARTEAVIMIFCEELGVPKEKIVRAMDIIARYDIIAQEERLDAETSIARREQAYRDLAENIPEVPEITPEIQVKS